MRLTYLLLTQIVSGVLVQQRMISQSAFPDITPDVYKINSDMPAPPPLPELILTTDAGVQLVPKIVAK